MTSEERIARDILAKINQFSKQPESPEGPDVNTFAMDLIIKALKDARAQGNSEVDY